MSEEDLEIVRRIYCRPLSLDPDLLDGLAELATPETVFDFTDAYPDGRMVKGVDGVKVYSDRERALEAARRSESGGEAAPVSRDASRGLRSKA